MKTTATPIPPVSTAIFLEALEDRIAPAGLVSFTDVDGDTVQVKSSKGTNADLQAALHITDGQLQAVDFAGNPLFQGTSLDILVQSKGAKGDGFVNVGLIDAHGIDLASVNVKGDLGKILVGDSNDTTAALKTLTVHSMGLKGTSTQAEGGDLYSVIIGSTSTFKVDTSIQDASLTWNSVVLTGRDIPDAPIHTSVGHANVSTITIGNNIVGSDKFEEAGSIFVDGNVNSFSLGGNIVGGSGDSSGNVQANAFNTVKIGGSILGGFGLDSGKFITTKNLTGNMTVGGNVIGSDGEGSGEIDIVGNSSASISVGGNVQGGLGDESGALALSGKFSTVSVGGSLIGGSGVHSGSIADQVIQFNSIVKGQTVTSSVGSIAKLAIGGSIYGGAGSESAEVTADTVGAFSVGGNISAVPKTGTIKTLDPVETTDIAVVHFNTATSIVVGGNLVGSDSADSGQIIVDSDVTSFQLKGSVFGGGGDNSGQIDLSAATALKSTIGGKIVGGAGDDSGAIALFGGGIHTLAVGGKVFGGEGQRSGYISALGNISSLAVGGDLVGGSGLDSGVIDLTGNSLDRVLVSNVTVTSLSIAGGLIGGTGQNSADVYLNNATTVSIGGDVQGEGDGSARLLGNTITTLKIGGDVAGSEGDNSGLVSYTTGTSLAIGGSIIGSVGDSSGWVGVGSLSTVNVDGGITGGEGDQSGFLTVGGKGIIKTPEKGGKTTALPLTVNIGGDITGGSGLSAGSVVIDSRLKLESASASVLTMTVGGDVTGGTAEDAGSIGINTSFASLKIAGSVTGGTAENTGSISFGPAASASAGTIAIGGSLVGGVDSSDSGSILANRINFSSITIGGNVVGGDASEAEVSQSNSGAILAGTLSSLSVGGSLISGQTGHEGDLNLGAIRAGVLGSVTVAGSIAGTYQNPFLITGQGASPSSTLRTNIAINSINVLGNVEYANILAGYDTSGTTINGDGGENGGTASIGTVHVGGDWLGSSIAAGVDQGGSGEWGTLSNHLLGKGESALVASIASIVIDGIAQGDPSSLGDDQHGFVSQKITSLSAGGFTYVVPPAPDSVQVGPDGDLVARLVTGIIPPP